MANTLQDLIDRRAKVYESVQEIGARPVDGTTGLRSAEDSAALDKALTDLAALNTAVEQERALVRAAEEQRTIDTKAPETRGAGSGGDGAAGRAPATGRYEDTDAYRDAFREFMVRGMSEMDPEQRRVMLPAASEVRAQGVATGAAGGFLVPQGFLASLQVAQKLETSMLDVADVIETDNGADLLWPTFDGTAQVGTIVSENTPITDLDVSFGSKTIKAHMYSSRMVKASLQVLQDSAFDLEGSFLPDELGRRIGRALNLHFTIGVGTTEPQGIVTGLPVGVTAAAGATTTYRYSELLALKHSVNPAYRGQARWLMSDGGVLALSTLVDTTGRPIWAPSLVAGAPDLLLGHPITINTDMAAPAANAKSVVFGDIRRAYLIRRVRGVTLVRFGERYMDALQIGFLAFARYDGMVRDTAAAKVLQNSAT